MIKIPKFKFGAQSYSTPGYQFGQPEPDPLGTFRSRFSLSPNTTLEEDAETLRASEKPARKFLATEALMQHVMNQPKREDNQLSGWGKFGAALSAGALGFTNPVAGVALGRELADRPHTNAMQDWASKGDALRAGAELESEMYGRDVDYQKMMHDFYKNQADINRDEERLNLDKDKYGLDVKKFNQEQDNWIKEYELDRDKLIQDGWREVIDKDGNLKLINDQSKEERDLGPTNEATRMRILQQQADASTTSAGARVTSAEAAQANAATAFDRLQEDKRSNVANETLESQRNNISAMDAETRKQQLELNKRNIESLISDRDLNKITAPEFELRAQAAAAKEVVLENPNYAKFINEDGTLKDIDRPAWQKYFWGDEDIQDFISKVRAKLNDIRIRKKGEKVEDGTIQLPPIKSGGA